MAALVALLLALLMPMVHPGLALADYVWKSARGPGEGDAPALVTYMKGDGTTRTQTLSVPANTRSTVRVKDKLGEGNDAAHDFSAKVECTNGQTIIAERPMYFNYNGWTGGHDVAGYAK